MIPGHIVNWQQEIADNMVIFLVISPFLCLRSNLLARNPELVVAGAYKYPNFSLEPVPGFWGLYQTGSGLRVNNLVQACMLSAQLKHYDKWN